MVSCKGWSVSYPICSGSSTQTNSVSVVLLRPDKGSSLGSPAGSASGPVIMLEVILEVGEERRLKWLLNFLYNFWVWGEASSKSGSLSNVEDSFLARVQGLGGMLCKTMKIFKREEAEADNFGERWHVNAVTWLATTCMQNTSLISLVAVFTTCLGFYSTLFWEQESRNKNSSQGQKSGESFMTIKVILEAWVLWGNVTHMDRWMSTQTECKKQPLAS